MNKDVHYVSALESINKADHRIIVFRFFIFIKCAKVFMFVRIGGHVHTAHTHNTAILFYYCIEVTGGNPSDCYYLCILKCTS